MARAFVGTSGWNYKEWRGDFFPEDLPRKRWLDFYASRFDSVEINYTFYRLPSKETCEAWYRQTPARFRFAVKASRYITHIRRLREARKAWNEFLQRVLALEEKLGVILLQFPSNFEASESNLQSVEEFLEYAGGAASPRLAFEFRNQSCFGSEMVTILRKYRAAMVIPQSSKYPVPEDTATSDFAYFRFHGPKEMFASSYSAADVRRWTQTIRRVLEKRRDVYVYFNNDMGGHAPRNAQSLHEQIETGRRRSIGCKLTVADST